MGGTARGRGRITADAGRVKSRNALWALLCGGFPLRINDFRTEFDRRPVQARLLALRIWLSSDALPP
jgi:hypothetical protein